MLRLSIAILLALGMAQALSAANVDFPGPTPGMTRAIATSASITLENDVISASWLMPPRALQRSSIINRLSGESLPQCQCELFRLATHDKTKEPRPGVACAIVLGAATIQVMVSNDGGAWHQLATLPRKDFPGEPVLIRVGKMNAKAEAKSHSTDGPRGEASIVNVTPLPTTQTINHFDFKTTAHEAKVEEFAFPTGHDRISCRIIKGTDQGETWGPAMALIWKDGEKFLAVGVRNDQNPLAPTINLFTPGGEQILQPRLPNSPDFDVSSSAFHPTAPPHIVDVGGDPHGVRLADRIAGKAIECSLDGPHGIHAAWQAELRDGSNYVRETVTFSTAEPLEIRGIELFDAKLPAMETIGTAPGCPIAGHGLFAGVEMPGSQNSLAPREARIGFPCRIEISPRQPYTFSSVLGVAPPGQLRRAFLYYLERERARPTSPFLHYNGWYDAAPSATHIMNVVKAFDEELHAKRGVTVKSFLVDDGWDSIAAGLWQESPQAFPQGFKGLKAEMEKYNARLGVWISPLGGYGGAPERTQLARKMGLIPSGAALDFSYSAYKQWFQDRCARLMREGGVNAFKWDRAGEGVTPHFMALLDIAHQLRKIDPKVFINVTVGTWPSPFWLNHVDCTWRMNSSDVGWTGKSDNPKSEQYNRQRWLTFRDGYCHRLFVQASPLYPLNSVMHHGIVYGRAYQGGDLGRSNGPDLKSEARSYFANGTTLQELYLSYSLMTPAAWDAVAEAARWGQANADVLADSHWVGGDPLKLEVYGYAAWNRRKGTLMLRNPDDRPQSIDIDINEAFELPASSPRRYRLTSPYADQRVKLIECEAGKKTQITLEPFEVLVFDADPQ